MPEPVLIDYAPTERQRQLAAWHLTSGRRILWRVPLTLALSVLLILLFFRMQQEDLRAEVPRLRAALQALAPAPVPDEQNAALDLRKFGTIRTPRLNFAPHSELLPVYVTGLDALADEIEAATRKATCNWNNNYAEGHQLELAHLSPARSLARVLMCRIRFLAGEGRHTEAADKLEAAYRLARHVAADDFSISKQIGLSCELIALTSLEAALLWEPPQTLQECARYREVLHLKERNGLTDVARSLNTEYHCWLLELCVADARGETPAELNSLRDAWPLKSASGAEYRNFTRAYPRLRERLLRPDKLTPDAAEMAEIIQAVQSGPALAVTSAGLNIRSYVVWTLAFIERLQALDTALAVRQFQLKYKRDPATLQELVPEFLEQVPVSPLSAQPIKFCVDNNGMAQKISGKDVPRFSKVLRIYGFGLNFKDDNGQTWGEVQASTGNDDTAIRLQPYSTPGEQ